jgi:hypothetical protein
MNSRKDTKKQNHINAINKEILFIDSLCTIIKIPSTPNQIDSSDTLQIAQKLFDVYAVVIAQKKYYAAMNGKSIKRKINAFKNLILLTNKQLNLLKKEGLKSIGLNNILLGKKASLSEITALVAI